MHTKKSKRQRTRDGLYNASSPPYGYRHTGGPKTPPEIVPEEAEVVRFVFESYATGRHSYQGIVDLVNSQSHKSRSGRRFTVDSIADMIRNRFYAGKVVYKAGSRRQGEGEVYDGLHDPIISEEIWEACFQIRQKHRGASRPFQTNIRPYLLGQLARCHICRRRLRVHNARSGLYYREMSRARGFDDCPHTGIGARGDSLHQQIGIIVRELQLPSNWQQELTDLIGQDKEVSTLNDQWGRLVAERRRLKEGYIRGDFDTDTDIYHRALERIRRELDQIPTGDELYRIKQAAQYLETISEIWEDASESDQRDLIRLMVREVQVNVPQSRLISISPSAPFIPLFRSIPMLQERDLGTFAPVWSDDDAASFPGNILTPFTEQTLVQLDESILPFVLAWPWPPAPEARISTALSNALKDRRQVGVRGGRVMEVPHPAVPGLLLDTRKWPDVSLERLSLDQLLSLPEGSLAYLETPLVLQEHPERESLVDRIGLLLEQQGYWHFYDIIPASMPAHWLYNYFPGSWSLAQGMYWNAYQLYNVLLKTGLHIRQQEHTFHQSISLGAAYRIAQQRPGLLKLLNDDAYQAGMDHLAAAAQKGRGETLIGSEVTLVEIRAINGEPPKRKRGRKQGT